LEKQKDGFSRDWKVSRTVFPRLGKKRGNFSRPWKSGGGFFQAWESAKENKGDPRAATAEGWQGDAPVRGEHPTPSFDVRC
jgi:hypothetical protein